jgi:hypothetical protein
VALIQEKAEISYNPALLKVGKNLAPSLVS